MSEHKVNLSWKDESEDFSYKKYERTHCRLPPFSTDLK